MSRQTNRLQRMAEKVSDGPLGGWEEGLAATEISTVAMPVASRGVGVGARDRALAGLMLLK